MKKNKIIVLIIALSVTFGLNAQTVLNNFELPSIDGYKLLRCDFHMHTVYSDGMVWPTVRVDEAINEGLDAIALTEHIEFRPKLEEFTSKDHNKSFELTEKYIKNKNLILVRGTEITRRMTPGHFNAIFIKDANPFADYVNKDDTRDGSNIVATLEEAKKQGGFVFWNHPWFQHKQDISEWASIHEDLFKKGLISGIEVVNGKRFDPLVLQWCLDKNLTVMATSDIHTPMYLHDDEQRPVTIIFAKDKNANAIYEALNDRRTVAFFDKQLAGKESLVRQIVENSIQSKMTKSGKNGVQIELNNTTSIPYTMRLNAFENINKPWIANGSTFIIPPHGRIILNSKLFESETKTKQISIAFSVLNAHIGKDKQLSYKLTFDL